MTILTANCRYSGVSLKPSMKNAKGTKKIKEMIVITEKRLILSRASCPHQYFE